MYARCLRTAGFHYFDGATSVPPLSLFFTQPQGSRILRATGNTTTQIRKATTEKFIKLKNLNFRAKNIIYHRLPIYRPFRNKRQPQRSFFNARALNRQSTENLNFGAKIKIFGFGDF